MKTYTNINDVFIDGIKEIKKNGKDVDSVIDVKSVGSYFGSKLRPFREVQGHSFRLINPRFRLISNKVHTYSLGFALANFIWVLLGKKDTETISFYNKRGLAFSDNGEYYESAFGDRIFGTYNLWENAKSLLKKDPSSRRALIPIFFPNDGKNLPLDTSCAAYIQVFIRENKLDMILSMRSQSSIFVFPYDIFLFTMLQEYFSLELGYKLGTFTYFCNSFHYYNDEEMAGLQAWELHKKENVQNDEMLRMSILTSQNKELLSFIETKIREYCLKGDEAPLKIINQLPEYWKQIMIVLLLKGLKETNSKPDISIQMPANFKEFTL